MEGARLTRRDRTALVVQREAGRLLAPLTLPISWLVMRVGMGWRIEGAKRTRAEFRRLRGDSPAPLLLCANHLTMLDSVLVAWALGTPASYLARWSDFPWNTPERSNFATSWWQRALIYVFKCLPISRGGDREAVAAVLARVSHLLAAGQTVLVFPEGGRSRSGRVDESAAAYGVGRIVRSVPGCRVLCVYLRGEGQESWSALPARGERFRVEIDCIEPKSHHTGLRGSVDVARQVVRRLAEMEGRWFDARE